MMKLLLALTGTLVLVFFIIQLYAKKSQKSIETYPYSVIKTYDDFEIRQYESRLFTAVTLPSNEYEKVSSKGFSILAGYIFGGNENQEKIAMTSPVAENSLPKPNDNQIQFKKEPAKMVAAVTFGGWANQSKIEQHKIKLIALLQKQQITHSNQFYFLGYNAPFETYNRRNEVIVVLDDFSLN